MLLAMTIAAAFSARPHIAIAAGGGLAYGIVGVHAEGRLGPVAAFFAVGADLATESFATPPAYAAGLRLLPLGDESGPVLSAHVAWSSANVAGAPSTAEFDAFDATYFGGTAGWRLRFTHGFFAEFGVGVAVLRRRVYGFLPSPQSGYPNSCLASSSPGEQRYCGVDHKTTLDADLALGFEF